MNRRRFLTGTGSALATAVAMPCLAAADPFADSMLAIEAAYGGRLGVAVLDTGTGARLGRRSAERFAMCSTFKLLACGAVLARVDSGKDNLSRQIRFAPSDLVTYSPVTAKRVASGMTLGELCEAALTRSDNTAANLILVSLGGPAAVTAYARALGDQVTRLDRIETELNEATPGDPRDTTTPEAMLGNVNKLVLGEALSASSRQQLTTWLLANKTGGARLRAGVPSNWRVGDKTGAGEHGTTNDVGVLWPPSGKPVIVAAYLTETKAPMAEREVALALVARAAVRSLARN